MRDEDTSPGPQGISQPTNTRPYARDVLDIKDAALWIFAISDVKAQRDD